MNKICYKCGLLKDISYFYKDMQRKDGHNSKCKECHKKYIKQHYIDNYESYKTRRKQYKEKIREWYKSYKSTLICNNCKENRICLLDFHHIDIKYKNIANMVSSAETIEKIKLEMSKCIVLCKSCHIKEHYPNKK